MIAIFFIAFVFSYVGSIPPGAINISVAQLAAENKIISAIRFSLAAAIVEFPYVIIAVIFSDWLLSSELIITNIKLIAASVMIILGIINTFSYFKTKSKGYSELPSKSGFRRGLVISIFNPLAIPFWIGVTAYILNMGWVSIDTNWTIFIYALGVSAGTFALLATLIYLSRVMKWSIQNKGLAKLIPAVIFYILGLYALFQLFYNG